MTKKDSKIVTCANGTVTEVIFLADCSEEVDQQTMHEDELPEMTDEEYDAWYAKSYIPDGFCCRIGPVVKK